jgi:hypothetical protein
VKFLALILALLPCAAGAETWKQLFSDYEYSVSVDTDSIERANGTVTAWVQQHYVKEIHYDDRAYNVLNGLNTFDCKKKRVSLLKAAVYLDKTPVESYAPTQGASNRPIIPGTVEHFAYQFLCKSEKATTGN